MPEQRELTLVHGDFHLPNVIASTDGDEIRAILDWELCTLGDPVADLGGLLAYWPRVGDVAEWTFPVRPLTGFAAPAELAELYAAVTGRDLTALPFWHALALWKIAVICEGVRQPRPVRSGAVSAGRLQGQTALVTGAARASGR